MAWSPAHRLATRRKELEDFRNKLADTLLLVYPGETDDGMCKLVDGVLLGAQTLMTQMEERIASKSHNDNAS